MMHNVQADSSLKTCNIPTLWCQSKSKFLFIFSIYSVSERELTPTITSNVQVGWINKYGSIYELATETLQ